MTTPTDAALPAGVPTPTNNDYEEWLEETGRDDSFVGCPERGIPGTYDDFLADWVARYKAA